MSGKEGLVADAILGLGKERKTKRKETEGGTKIRLKSKLRKMTASELYTP